MNSPLQIFGERLNKVRDDRMAAYVLLYGDLPDGPHDGQVINIVDVPALSYREAARRWEPISDPSAAIFGAVKAVLLLRDRLAPLTSETVA